MHTAGSVSAEIIAGRRLEVSFMHLHLPECLHRTGSKQALHQYYGLDTEGIFRQSLELADSGLALELPLGAERSKGNPS
jgi:transketolase C-terminal domain/subunit